MDKRKTILQVENLSRWFGLRRTVKEIINNKKRWVKAVDKVSFDIREQEICALVGESGCGKTTIARCIMKLIEPTSGRIVFRGQDVTNGDKKEEKEYRKQVQMIFQDPYASMNPRFRAGNVLEEPLLVHREKRDRKERRLIMTQSLSDVRLMPPEEFMSRFPHMLSGGQRQRVAIARALVLSPALIIADEPVSMIDLSTRAEILFMMKQLREKRGLSFLYITHDLSTARYFADRIAVMYLGRIVESGKADDVILNPHHPYTKALIASVCEPLPGRVKVIKEIPVKGDVPPPSEIPPGCRFHPRCVYAVPECSETEPVMKEVEPGHLTACHLFG